MYMDGRVRLYESTRWITINCLMLVLNTKYFRNASDVLDIQVLIFGKRCFVAMSDV